MIKRVCPKCKTPWYSANETEEWICDNCREKLPISLNENPN